jgi:hypothetical protein
VAHARDRPVTLSVGGDALVSAVRALGERLNDHVRFEERELFVHLEGTLDEVTLERLGHAVQAAEAAE